MKITLNGGNFGGQEIEAMPGQIIEMADDVGTWLYSPSLNKSTATAEFIGMKNKAE